MEQKRIDIFCEIKEVEDSGSFKGIASVYGVEDLDGDVIDRGAFTKTIAENPTVPILWQHRAEMVVGEGTLKEWQNKILIEGKLDLDDDDAKKAYGKLKKRLVKGLSIGFQTMKSTWEQVNDRMIRHIGELKLWEVSIVTFPAQPAAQVTRVKSAEDERIARLESQVSALQAAAVGGSSTTPQGAGKSGPEAAGQTQTPDEVHSAAETVLRLLKGTD